MLPDHRGQDRPPSLAPGDATALLATVRRQFTQRAARIGAHAALLREVDRRLIERLEPIRIDPRRIIDLGCGCGASRAPLQQRFARSTWVGVDLCEAILARGRPPARWLARLWSAAGANAAALRVCADGAALPLADAAADLVYSNLMLHWHPAPNALLAELRRVLRPDGLLLFSCFGPDTLKELRAACALALPQARPLPFADMHDVGDALVASGFSSPVLDVECIELTYASPRALLAEVRALGANPRPDRPQALPSSRQCRALLAALDARRNGAGRIGLTIEVVYAHAWRAAPAAARNGGESRIALDRVRERLRRR